MRKTKREEGNQQDTVCDVLDQVFDAKSCYSTRPAPHIARTTSADVYSCQQQPNLHPTALPIHWEARAVQPSPATQPAPHGASHKWQASPVEPRFFFVERRGEKRGTAQGQNKHGRGLELQQEEYRNWKGEEKEEHVLFARCIVGICSVVHGLQILVFLCSVSLNTNHVPTLCSCSPD